MCRPDTPPTQRAVQKLIIIYRKNGDDYAAPPTAAFHEKCGHTESQTGSENINHIQVDSEQDCSIHRVWSNFTKTR